MTYKGIVRSTIISILSIILIFTVYWTESSSHLWNISLITGLTIILYYVNTRFYQSADIYLKEDQVYKRFKPFKLKKRYFLWIVCVTIFIESIITISILKLDYNTENQQRVNEAMKAIPFVDSITRIGILSPIIEEIIFRGLLYMVCSGMILLIISRMNRVITKPKLDRITGITFIVLSSVSFGIPHVIRAGDFENLAPYVLSGFVLSVLYVVTKTLYVPILLHMINNIISTFGSSYRAGIINIDLAYGLAVFVFLYIIVGLITWGFIHNKRVNAISDEINKEYKALGLKRSAAAKRQINAFFTYVKGQMIVK